MRAVNLDRNKVNGLLKLCNYFEIEPEISVQYLSYLKDSLAEDINKFPFPACVMSFNTLQLLSNNFMNEIMYQNKPKNFENKSHIEILFDLKYGLRQRILNWDVFYKGMIETVYKVYNITHKDIGFKKIIEDCFKYEEFKNYWNQLESQNFSDFNFYSNIIIFKSEKLGNLKFAISAFPLHSDKRFMIQQFIPIE